MKDIYAVVAASIRRERLEADLTIEDLAGKASISPSFLSYIETNRRKPSIATLGRIAEALQIPVSRFFLDLAKSKGAYKTAQRLNQLVHEAGDKEQDTLFEVVKAVSKALGRRSTRKRPR